MIHVLSVRVIPDPLAMRERTQPAVLAALEGSGFSLLAPKAAA